jgi:uncharacterized membrane protein (DUF4010 family)
VPLLAAALFQAVAAFLLIGRDGAHANGEKAEALVHKNPFLLSEVLKFGAILAVVMLAAGIAQSVYGNSGLWAVAAISGLADVDAMTLSIANMGPATSAGVGAILLTIGVNNLAKSIYGWITGGNRLGVMLFTLNMAAIAVAVAAWWFVPPLSL